MIGQVYHYIFTYSIFFFDSSKPICLFFFALLSGYAILFLRKFSVGECKVLV